MYTQCLRYIIFAAPGFLILEYQLVQLQVGCHIQPNTIGYTVDYSKQNGTGFRFIRVKAGKRYNDLLVHSEIFISLMHICDHGP